MKQSRHFLKADIQMANKHKKRCWMLLIIKEMHFKITMRDHTTLQVAIIKKPDNKCQ